MNCIIYGTKCEYTTSWPQQTEKRKDENNGNCRSRLRKKQRISDDEEEKEARSAHSRSPTADEEERLEAECSGQSVTDAADHINHLPDRAAEAELEEKGKSTSIWRRLRLTFERDDIHRSGPTYRARP